MKRLINIFLLTLIFLFPACNDDFLSVEPQDRYSDAAVWSDPALANAFVNDIYINLHYGFQVEMLDSFSDISMTKRAETMPIVSSDLTDSDLSVLTPGHWLSSFENLNWNSLYDNVRATNIYFENIESSDLEGQEIDELTGEVHFLRAYNYYWLMSLFGGVPIIETAYSPTDDLLVERSTFAETVDFIVADLDAAAALLPISGDKTRATRGAALALKARVLLYAASDLFNSEVSYNSSYSNPELVSYIGGDRNARWRAAKDAAEDVMDLGVYSLYGGTNPASAEEAKQNYIDIFLNNSTSEDIFLQYYDNINRTDWQTPDPGLHYGPNGYHGWGNNTPLQSFIDSFEMIDGTQFDWNNSTHSAAPYENRDPRFYANILYDGAEWRERPDDVSSIDPDGIIETAFYENEDGTFSAGLDTRQGPFEDWNGTYTGYYIRKFIDPGLDHQYERQMLPWRQIRYAEVLLNYVEASLELGEESDAIPVLNRIRNRAGMPDIPSGETGEDLMDRYRNERKIELAYEQHRFFDIRRWMIAPDVMNQARGTRIEYPFGSNTPTYSIIDIGFQTRNWKDKAYFLPILLDEINRNELLIQNPGY